MIGRSSGILQTRPVPGNVSDQGYHLKAQQSLSLEKSLASGFFVDEDFTVWDLKKTKTNSFCVCVCVYRQIYCYCYFLVAKSCLTLCNPMDCRLPGSPVHGISQARILEWVAIPFSRESSQHPWGSSLSLLHWQENSLPLSHQGSSYRYTCRERGERDLKKHYNLP